MKILIGLRVGFLVVALCSVVGNVVILNNLYNSVGVKNGLTVDCDWECNNITFSYSYEGSSVTSQRIISPMLIVSSIELDKTLRGATPKILGTPDDLEVSDNVTIKTDTARIKITIMSIIMFTILFTTFS